MSERILDYLVKRYLVRVVRLAYPLVLWASLLRMSELIGYSPGTLVSSFTKSLKPIYTYIGVAAFAFLLRLGAVGHHFFSISATTSFRSSKPTSLPSDVVTGALSSL